LRLFPVLLILPNDTEQIVLWQDWDARGIQGTAERDVGALNDARMENGASANRSAEHDVGLDQGPCLQLAGPVRIVSQEMRQS